MLTVTCIYSIIHNTILIQLVVSNFKFNLVKWTRSNNKLRSNLGHFNIIKKKNSKWDMNKEKEVHFAIFWNIGSGGAAPHLEARQPELMGPKKIWTYGCGG